jgi:hypothetical protein
MDFAGVLPELVSVDAMTAAVNLIDRGRQEPLLQARHRGNEESAVEISIKCSN